MNQIIQPNQTLKETWEITYRRLPWSSSIKDHHEARWDFMAAGTAIGGSGVGRTVEEAKLDLLVKMAANFASFEDLDPRVSDETLDYAVKLMRREQSRRRRERLKAVA